MNKNSIPQRLTPRQHDVTTWSFDTKEIHSTHRWTLDFVFPSLRDKDSAKSRNRSSIPCSDLKMKILCIYKYILYRMCQCTNAAASWSSLAFWASVWKGLDQWLPWNDLDLIASLFIFSQRRHLLLQPKMPSSSQWTHAPAHSVCHIFQNSSQLPWKFHRPLIAAQLRSGGGGRWGARLWRCFSRGLWRTPPLTQKPKPP